MTRKRACDVCYRRKIQCSISSPESRCEWCDEHDLSCTFDREAKKRKRKRLRLSDVEGLFNRVEQLENAFAESRSNRLPLRSGPPESQRITPPAPSDGDDIIQSESSPGIPSSATESTEPHPISVPVDVQPTYLSLGQNPATGVPLAQYWYSRGIPLLSDRGHQYICLKTGQNPAVEKLQVASYQSKLQCLATPVCYSNREIWRELPPKETVQKSASVFFNSSFQRDFPILDNMLFEKTIDEAYDFIDGKPSPSQAQSIACVFAMLSISGRPELPRKALSIRDNDTYANKAQCILGHMMTTGTTVVGLQTVLALQRYYMFTGRIQSAALLHAIACRMVCALGGHTHDLTRHTGPELTWAQRQGYHLRMLFWSCYILDKDISLRSGQPPLLTEEYCDLTIPEICTSYSDQLRGSSNKTITIDRYHFHMQGNPGLCRLKEKIHRLLFSPHAFKLSDRELVLRIRQLDDDLESWRLSLPPEIRPKLSIPTIQTMPNQKSDNTLDIRHARLQLEYHHLVTAIHTTVRRCGADYQEHSDLPDDLHNVIHSSCDLSLEASRSTITFLKSPTTSLIEQEFSDVIFYTTLSVVSLFIDILAHPQNAESHAALDYLSSAINIIKNLSIPNPTQDELKCIQETNRFIRELIHLGRCAMEKAQRDTRKIDGIQS
ncbi:hypothetical protein F4860DRAFT_457649 [Xylaria cubensis]|nr:hypothetical protein F4860DRAFT_457649 [Xylaria cubensis]